MFSNGADQYLRPWLDKYINDLVAMDPSKSGGSNPPTSSSSPTGNSNNPTQQGNGKRSLFEMALGL
jgi:hypothetical protein